jgi:hypothetical protein
VGKGKKALSRWNKLYRFQQKHVMPVSGKGCSLPATIKAGLMAKKSSRHYSNLSKDLSPILLMPLYWLEEDRPAVFVKYIKPLCDFTEFVAACVIHIMAAD